MKLALVLLAVLAAVAALAVGRVELPFGAGDDAPHAAVAAPPAAAPQGTAPVPARVRRDRLALPEVTLATVARAQGACRRYRSDLDPYLFGAGLQDPRGQIEGFRAARRGVARGLDRAAYDAIDRRKLAPLLRKVRAGDAVLAGADRAAAAADLRRAQRRLAAYDRHVRAESRLASRLGLGGCLAVTRR